MIGGFMGVLTEDVLVTCILMGLVGVVGLAGNALMLRALIKYRNVRTDFYTVFGSLSVADSIFLLVSVPAYIVELVVIEDKANAAREAWCKASHYLMNTCSFIAAYLVVVLAVLRGILLTNRGTIRRPQARHLLLLSIVFYIVAILSTIPVVHMYTSYKGMCYFAVFEEARRETWLLNSFSSFVPLFLVAVIYFMTYMLGKRYFADSYSPREKEKSRLVTSVIVAFSICQIPHSIASIYETYIDPEDEAKWYKLYTIKNYLMCLVMADKAVRPVLYSKLASDLSDAFDEVVNCTHCFKPYAMTPLTAQSSQSSYVPSTPGTVTTYISSSESNPAGFGERTESSSSSASASSQTPLTRPEEVIEMKEETLS